MVGIVDQALEVGGSDDLDISAYHEALVDFIKKTDTPMTIGSDDDTISTPRRAY